MDGLFSVLVTLGVVPIIRCPKVNCRCPIGHHGTLGMHGFSLLWALLHQATVGERSCGTLLQEQTLSASAPLLLTLVLPPLLVTLINMS